MTPAKAAEIRAEIITGNRLSRKALREQRNSKENAEKKLKFQELEKQFTDYRLLKEKWFLFTKSATESFSLWDSELNVVELNDATLRLLPDGTKKNEIIGKNLSELSPDSKADGVYEKFVKVIETGEPLFIDDYVPPPRFGEDLHFNLKAFKVGNELGIIMTDITDRNRAEGELKKRQVELERKTSDLEEMNTALNVLLEKREKDKFELEENITRNVKELVESYLEKLKGTRLDNRQRIYAEIIEKNLNNIVSPFIRAINADFLALTHTEIQISNLIKHGKSTKEIAELLVLSPRTIDSYREQIRSKLGIKNKKVNLRTYLNSIQ
jgi:DNA-binding NarL/FixJ family response regulator